MNKNLKNRPHLICLQDILTKQEQKQFLDMLEKQHPKVFKAWIENTKYNPDEWFEDFEKQLREILEFEEKEGQSSNRKRSMVAHFQIDLLKEILGE